MSATTSTTKKSKRFSDEEQAAMKERAKELKADKAGGESAVLAMIAEMQGTDRLMAERLHVLVGAVARHRNHRGRRWP